MSRRYTLKDGGVAVVTGASAGIGVELARQLAARGYDLVLAARRKDRLAELAAEIHTQYGVKALACPLDLAQVHAAEKLHAFTQEHHQDVSLLVNNAGFGWDGVTADMPARVAEEMIHLNMLTLTQACRLFAPDLIRRGGGGILNVSSVAGMTPMPRFAVYAATKAYVNSFSQALAVELEPQGVRVCCVCPGGTSTEFAQVSGREEDKLPFLRMSAEEVARLGLKGFDRGETLTVTGPLNRAAAVFSRWIPENLLMKVLAMGMKA